MEKLKEFIEKKKEKSASRKPRYGTRKLSVGLVSCVLGYCIFLSPTVVSAQVADGEVSESTQISETREVTETSKASDTEAVESSKVESPAKEVASENLTVEAPAEEVSEAVVEEKEALPALEEKVVEERETADQAMPREEAPEEITEEEVAEEAIENKEAVVKETEVAKEEAREEQVDPLAEEVANEEELLLNEEVDPEAVAAPADENREPKDISNDVQSKYVALTEEGHETKGTVKPDAGEAIGWEVSFTSPRGTIAGDYFTIDLSDNLSLKGIEPDHENEYPIEINDKVVADGVRLDRSTIKYTFNENINDERNVVVSIKGFAYIDKTKVPNNSPKEKISIKVGDTVDEHNINVQYGKPYYTGDSLNGMSQFTEFNPETGEYTQVFYINPDSKTITTSNRNWATGKVAMFIDGLTPDGSPSDVNYKEENTKVSIQKLPAGADVPSAIIENPVQTDEPTNVKTTFRDGGIEIVFADNSDDKLRKNNIDSPYIITVKSKAAPSQTGNNVYSRATFYGDGSKFHIMDNNIVTTVGDTEAQGEKIGYFKEHHVYYTKVDGVLQKDKTFTLHSNKTEGHDYDKYFTSKNVIDDFKFIKVDTGKLVENPVYNEDGTIARGNYEPGKTKEVTYIYERDITSGKFQEHHIYQTVDEKGNVLTTDDTVNKDETKGIDEDSYKTSKIDRDGYTLTEVKATNDESAKLGVKFDSKGAETTGNYVNGKKLEVTYIYQKEEQKPVEEKGFFQEHHIYQTKKLDGSIVQDDKDDKDVTEGTEKESYKTSKQDREGYKLIEVSSTNGGKFNEDGSEKEANYIANKKQEVTYIYQKEESKQWTPIEETGKFQEHHIYITKDKDGKEIKREVENGDVSGGTKDMTYETGKKEKDGFKFVRTENPVEGPSYNEKGETTTGKFKAGVKQEITYVYEKTVKDTPVSPSEPTKPEEPKDTTPLVPLTPAEEVEVERHSHHDHKTKVTTVVTKHEDSNSVKTEEKDDVKETEKVEEAEKAPETEKVPEENTKEVAEEKVTQEVVEEENIEAPQAPVEKTTRDDKKAPKTSDAGILSSVGLASLSASGLAYLELKKRNKKNK